MKSTKIERKDKIKPSLLLTQTRDFVRKEFSIISIKEQKEKNEQMTNDLLSITKIEYTDNKPKPLSVYTNSRNVIKKEPSASIINKNEKDIAGISKWKQCEKKKIS